MITNLLNDILKIVKGRNGTIFLVILAIFAVMFFIKVIPALINFLIVAAIIFVIFKYIQKKSSEYNCSGGLTISHLIFLSFSRNLFLLCLCHILNKFRTEKLKKDSY
jgi:hypothetical protein